MTVDKSDQFSNATLRVSSSSLTASEIASKLTPKPTRMIERSVKEGREESRWMLQSSLPDNVAVENHIEFLLQNVEKYRQEFDLLRQDCALDIWCTLSTESEFIGFALSNTVIQRAAQLGIEFVFSVYNDKEGTKVLLQ